MNSEVAIPIDKESSFFVRSCNHQKPIWKGMVEYSGWHSQQLASTKRSKQPTSGCNTIRDVSLAGCCSYCGWCADPGILPVGCKIYLRKRNHVIVGMDTTTRCTADYSLDAVGENHHQAGFNHNILGHVGIVTAQHQHSLFACKKHADIRT